MHDIVSKYHWNLQIPFTLSSSSLCSLWFHQMADDFVSADKLRWVQGVLRTLQKHKRDVKRVNRFGMYIDSAVIRPQNGIPIHLSGSYLL